MFLYTGIVREPSLPRHYVNAGRLTLQHTIYVQLSVSVEVVYSFCSKGDLNFMWEAGVCVLELVGIQTKYNQQHRGCWWVWGISFWHIGYSAYERRQWTFYKGSGSKLVLFCYVFVFLNPLYLLLFNRTIIATCRSYVLSLRVIQDFLNCLLSFLPFLFW